MILIKNATIVTQNDKREIIEKGVILINKDKIEFVGKKLPAKFFKKVEKVIDGKNKVVLPGLINAHTHLAMTLLRGYADDLPLEEWWFKRVYPVESKFGREEVYWGSLLAMIEMIKSGTTCFADFYYYEDEVDRAAREIGMRGVLGCGVLDVPTFEHKDADSALKQTEKLVAELKEKSQNYVSVAPHMFQTTSAKTYQKSKKLARRYDLLLQTHCAETKQEINFCLNKYKKRPVELLNEKNILDDKTLLAHCCWLSKKEIALLAKSRASVVHCSISNMKLASGIMSLTNMIEKGVNVCLGTDGSCSNNDLDMFGEMKTAALLHKINESDPTAAGAQTILDMATVNGAKALGLGDIVGSLEKNKKADIIVLDFYKPHLTPRHNIVSHLIYSARGSDVETVIIDGKIVMEGGCIKKVSERKVLSEVNKIVVSFK